MCLDGESFFPCRIEAVQVFIYKYGKSNIIEKNTYYYRLKMLRAQERDFYFNICIPMMIGWENKNCEFMGHSYRCDTSEIFRLILKKEYSNIDELSWVTVHFHSISSLPHPHNVKAFPINIEKIDPQEVFSPSVVSGRARGRRSFSFACDIVFFFFYQLFAE